MATEVNNSGVQHQSFPRLLPISEEAYRRSKVVEINLYLASANAHLDDAQAILRARFGSVVDQPAA